MKNRNDLWVTIFLSLLISRSQSNGLGVFVNEKTDVVIRTVLTHKLDYVQLHGDEAPDYCKIIKENGVGVIKVFPIENSFDFTITKLYEEYSDFFLFDTKSESRGGSGKVFDWNILNGYNQQTPFFLSGGISIENVMNIKKLTAMNLHAIDVNSGVELAPGKKDIQKIKSVMSPIIQFLNHAL